MRFFTIIVAILLGFNAVFAQGNPDKKAEKALKEVSKKYKSYKTLQVHFSVNQKSPQQANASPAQKGTVTMKGDAFKLEMVSQTIICDGKTIWTYMQDVKEVHVNNFDPGEDDITPSKIFNLYSKDFIYRSAGTVNEGGRALTLIDLTPKDKSRSYFLIKLKIDETKNEIVSAEIKEKNGSITTYNLTGQKSNIDLPGNFFTFNAASYKGVQVVDLR